MGIDACGPRGPTESETAEPERRSGVGTSPVRSLASGERDALLADLLRRYYGTLWRTLRRLGVEEHRVEDAVQEVFIVASRKLEQIELGRERSFLLSSAIRIAANYRRAGRARREIADADGIEQERDPTPQADQLLHRKQLRQALDAMLAGWPEDLRTAFILFELEGLSVPEIAELTATKTGTVASRLRRARELFLAATRRMKARGLIEAEVEP